MAKNFTSETKQAPMDASGLRFAIVVSRFNSAITDRLLEGAVDALKKSGAAHEDMEIVHVPGAFELPLATKKLASQGDYEALVAIGCVIRGETTHYDYVCSETARGIQLAQMDTGVPIIFCVLTCETQEQALARAGGEHGNKGYDSGLAAIEMGRLSQRLHGKLSQAAPAGKLQGA
jgi:6,7-dimethyl-8-ribityllumazine synthase